MVFFLVYFVYNLSLYGSVPGGDSGELVAESCQLGTPHPPGYPLHTLLSAIFQRIPIPRIHYQYYIEDESAPLWYMDIDWNPTVGWKLNNMCAMFAALAAALIGETCAILLSYQHKLDKQKTDIRADNATESSFFAPMLVTALSYAFSPLVWEYSIGSEVFALNNMLCAALIHITVSTYCSLVEIKLMSDLFLAHTTKDREGLQSLINSKVGALYRSIVLGGFISGLVLTNQHTSALLVLFLVPFMIMVVFGVFVSLPGYVSDTNVNSKTGFSATALLLWSAVSFIIGFVPPYSYLFFASSRPKPGSWGDMTTVEGLLRHILRSEYGTFKLGGIEGHEDVWMRITHYLLHIQNSSYNAGLPLALGGCLWLLWCNYRLSKSTTKASVLKPAVVSSPSTGTPGGKGKKKHHNSGATASAATVSSPALKTSVQSSTSVVYSLNPIVLCLVVSFVGYVFLWHGVLSNLPLDAPMPYAVHSRFWMQPDLFVALFAGVGVAALSSVISSLFGIMIMGTNITGSSFHGVEDGNSNKKNSRGWNTMDRLLRGVVDAVFVAVVLKFVAFDRFLVMNRSEDEYPYLFSATDSTPHSPYTQRGRVEAQFKGHSLVSLYGMAILNSLPQNALLASHTDMDWNAVRYLQKCEREVDNSIATTDSSSSRRSSSSRGLREDVTHVSFQLMPYPWFLKQQAPLYPTVRFPSPFRGISTSKLSEGNAMLILRFFDMNKQHLVTLEQEKRPMKDRFKLMITTQQNISTDKVAGGIFIDMQAISDVDIGAGGIWRDKYALIPWGLTFRVIPKLTIKQSATYHQHSYFHLSTVRAQLPHYSKKFQVKFDPGSWEWAAMSITHDAQYQFALNLLTYSIAMQKGADVKSLLLILDRLLTASVLLQDLHTVTDNDVMSTQHIPLSYPRYDLHKNTALSWLRLLGVSQICSKAAIFPAAVDALKMLKDDLLNYKRVRELLSAHNDSKQVVLENTEEPEKEPPMEMDRTQLLVGGALLTPELIQHAAANTITSFVRNYPADKDAETFKNSLKSMLELSSK